MDRPLFRLRLLALFLASVTVIAYEVAVMRVFAVGSWSNFGSMVISIALLGIGLAGTLLTIFENHLRRQAARLLKITAVLLGPAMAGAQIAAQRVPFNPGLIGADQTQFLWVGLYYLIYAVPFFIGAVFIGTLFVQLQERIHQVYFWNMLGSGVGGAVVLGLMVLLPPQGLVGPLVVLAAVTALLCFIQPNPKTSRLRVPLLPTSLLVLLTAGTL